MHKLVFLEIAPSIIFLTIFSFMENQQQNFKIKLKLFMTIKPQRLSSFLVWESMLLIAFLFNLRLECSMKLILTLG